MQFFCLEIFSEIEFKYVFSSEWIYRGSPFNTGAFYYMNNLNHCLKSQKNLFEDLICSEQPTAECQTKALGMESGAIADSQITASSQYSAAHGWIRARLNMKINGKLSGGWSVARGEKSPWIQVDLLHVTTVKGVATQGRNRVSQWVTTYKLQYSNDGQTFNDYKEEGQSAVKVIVYIAKCKVIVYIPGLYIPKVIN